MVPVREPRWRFPRALEATIGIAILLVAVGVWYSFRGAAQPTGTTVAAGSPDAARNGAPATTTGLAAQQTALKAPWAAGALAFRKREYATLIAAARTSPSTGSYTLAARALSQCAHLATGHATNVKRIDLDKDEGIREARRKALETLERPCSGLGEWRDMVAERDRLFHEGEQADDALDALLRTSYQLADPAIPRDARQAKAEALLAMQDGDALDAVRKAISAPGAKFDGDAISEVDRSVFGMAVSIAGCDLYGYPCKGADETSSLWDCAYHGDCGFEDGITKIRNMPVPILGWFIVAGIEQFSPRVRERLRQGRFSAFQVP